MLAPLDQATGTGRWIAVLGLFAAACNGPATSSARMDAEVSSGTDAGAHSDAHGDDLGAGAPIDALGDGVDEVDADTHTAGDDSVGLTDNGNTEDSGVWPAGDVLDGAGPLDAPATFDVDSALPDILPTDVSVDGDVDSASIEDTDAGDAGAYDAVTTGDVDSAQSDIVPNDSATDGFPDSSDVEPTDTGTVEPDGFLPDLTPFLCEGEDGSVLPAPPYDPCETEPEATEFVLEPTACPPAEPTIGTISTSVNLEPEFVYWDESCGNEMPCGVYGINALLPMDEHDVIVIGTAPLVLPGAVRFRPKVRRQDRFGAVKWEVDLGDLSDPDIYHWVDAASLTFDRNILVLAYSASPDLTTLTLTRWLISPDGSVLYEETAAKWDDEFHYWSAAAVNPGAIVAGSQHKLPSDPPYPCGYRSLTRIDEAGLTLWERTYSSPVAKPGGPADWINMSVVAVPGCGFAIIAPSESSPGPIHILRLNGSGDPVARWVYHFETCAFPKDVHSGVAGESIFVAAPRSSKPGLWYDRPALLRIDPSTGEAISLFALTKSPNNYTSPLGALGAPSGVVVLSEGGESPSVDIEESPTVHVFPPDGCPVASYAFPGLKGNLGELAAGLRFLTRLGDGTYAAVDTSKVYDPYLHSTHLYFFELPAVAELEAQLGAPTE